MSSAANIVEVAFLIGDAARAAMLAALMEGMQLTGGELAGVAGVSKSTASEHLSRLTAAGLIAVRRHGRFAYYRIGSPRVAAMLESMGVVAAMDTPPRYVPRSARGSGLEALRLCYDHLAGRVAVALADSMMAGGLVTLGEDGGLLNETGVARLAAFGVALPTDPRRILSCRPCLDWTERRYHIGGRLGAALACRCFELGWVRRTEKHRLLVMTPAGQAGLRQWFGLETLSVEGVAT